MGAECIIPSKHSAGFGSMWQCSKCKKRYQTKAQCQSHILNNHE